MKVKIENFQSIEKVELTVEGFTAIVGRSNIGKSAIVRAIEGAFTNKVGDHYVRDGASFTEVSIESPEIHLKWKKGSGYNDYEINGEKLESVGRGAPPHIAEAGFRELEISNKKINVQIASQFNPIFMIDPSQVSGAIAAEILSDVGRLSEVQTAFRDCSKEKRNLESVIRVREKDLIKNEKDLKIYSDIENEKEAVTKLKECKEKLERLQRELKDLEQLQEEYSELVQVINSYSGLDDIDIPEQDFEDLKILEGLGRLNQAIIEIRSVISTYDSLEHIKVPEQLDVAKEMGTVTVLNTFLTAVRNAQRDVETYQGVEVLEIPEKLSESLSEGLEGLRRLNLTYQTLLQDIPSCETQIQQIEKEIEECLHEIQHILTEAGKCPTCGEVF